MSAPSDRQVRAILAAYGALSQAEISLRSVSRRLDREEGREAIRAYVAALLKFEDAVSDAGLLDLEADELEAAA